MPRNERPSEPPADGEAAAVNALAATIGLACEEQPTRHVGVWAWLANEAAIGGKEELARMNDETSENLPPSENELFVGYRPNSTSTPMLYIYLFSTPRTSPLPCSFTPLPPPAP